MKKHFIAFVLPLLLLIGCARQPNAIAQKNETITPPQHSLTPNSQENKFSTKQTSNQLSTTAQEPRPSVNSVNSVNKETSGIPIGISGVSQKQTSSKTVSQTPSTTVSQNTNNTNTNIYHHVGQISVIGFPSNTIHKKGDLNISWSAEYANGYSFLCRGNGNGLANSPDFDTLSPWNISNITITSSQLSEGDLVDLTVHAIGDGGKLTSNVNFWTGSFMVLTLNPPVITYPKNDAVISKGNIQLSWYSTLDNESLPFYYMNDYNINVEDLTSNESVYNQKLHELGFKMYRNFTLPESVFISGHKYKITLDEKVNYQDYVSDQGPMVGSVIFSIS